MIISPSCRRSSRPQMSACGTPVPLKLQVALSEGTREVEVPPGSTLHDIQRTAKRTFPALKNVVRACT